ncbi:MAG TPA: methyltransferase [Solirubrobacteraceae bacterium]|nr:methyltransferase [Solirubrobacteraceae bacterium]
MLAARAVISGCTLGVFGALDERPDTPDGLAARLELDPLGVETLLTALRSLGYVEATGTDGELGPTETARRLLSPGSPESVADFLGAQNAHHWETLGRLDEVVRTGEPVGWHELAPGDPLWEAYIRGLYAATRADHDDSAAVVPVRDPRALIDVAGGHGGFAMAMCRRHPGLSATVLDLPASVAVGRRIVEEQGLAGRVGFREGDARDAGLGEELDVVSVFNLVHHLSPEENAALFARARAALGPGGCLVVGETERPQPGDDVPRQGALSGLLFYAMSRARTYTRTEMTGWLHDAGFPRIDLHRSEARPWRVVLVAPRIDSPA